MNTSTKSLRSSGITVSVLTALLAVAGCSTTATEATEGTEGTEGTEAKGSENVAQTSQAVTLACTSVHKFNSWRDTANQMDPICGNGTTSNPAGPATVAPTSAQLTKARKMAFAYATYVIGGDSVPAALQDSYFGSPTDASRDLTGGRSNGSSHLLCRLREAIKAGDIVVTSDGVVQTQCNRTFFGLTLTGQDADGSSVNSYAACGCPPGGCGTNGSNGQRTVGEVVNRVKQYIAASFGWCPTESQLYPGSAATPVYWMVQNLGNGDTATIDPASVQLTAPLSGSNGAVAAAKDLDTGDTYSVVRYPAESSNLKLPSTGALPPIGMPCSTGPLNNGDQTSNIIQAANSSGTFRKCAPQTN